MPIENYEKRAQQEEDRLMKNPSIADDTKRMLQRFLIAYDVSPARRHIFLTKIKPLLEYFPNLHLALTDRDAINSLFAELRRKYSVASYATYIGVSRRFLSWMNEGEQPKSMCDIRKQDPEKLKRKLRPEDMLAWDEGLRISRAFTSTQLSAICLTQLDCGFRPSEFIDLNYGDVRMETGLAVIQVHAGKTGSRTVIAYRCVPALLKWMDAHPTKRPEDPLWIYEKEIRSVSQMAICVRRYNYPAMRKRVREAAQRVGISKPMDFYALRHSSCVLDKIENLPVELAAESHYHS